MDKKYLQKLESIKTIGDCIKTSIALSGKDIKDIASSLGVDPAVFSRIIKGSQWFKPENIPQFCALTGNTLLIDWVCHQCGGRFVQHQELDNQEALEALIDKKIKDSNKEAAALFKQAGEAMQLISEKLSPDATNN